MNQLTHRYFNDIAMLLLIFSFISATPVSARGASVSNDNVPLPFSVYTLNTAIV